MAGLPTRVARVAALAVPDDGTPLVVGIVGSGGSDAPAVLDAVAARLAERGKQPLRMAGRRLERDDPLGALAALIDIPDGADPAAERKARGALLDRLSHAGALVVDDAQWLDPASLRVLVGVAERAEDNALSVVVAHRPTPGDAALAALDAALSRRRPLVVLAPLDEPEVAERAALTLGAAVDQALVEALVEESAGVPELVVRLARAWADTGVVAAGRLAAPPEGAAPAVVEAVRAEVDQLPPAARTTLAALSVGADLDDDLLGSVTGLAPDELGDAAAHLRSAGLLVADGEDVVPVVAESMRAMTPDADRRRIHARLAEALVARRAPPMQAAEAYVEAGRSLLDESPELARGWFERAAEAGATPLAAT